MIDSPSPNGNDVRGSGGRFIKGNSGGPGNPHAQQVAKLRSALLNSVTPDDLCQVMAALLTHAKGGDVPSIKELFQRLLGPAESIDLLARLDDLEQRIAAREG